MHTIKQTSNSCGNKSCLLAENALMSLPAICRLCACCLPLSHDCRCDCGLLWYCNEKIIWKEFSRAFLKQLIEQLQQQARTLFISFNHWRVFKDIKLSTQRIIFFPNAKKLKTKIQQNKHTKILRIHVQARYFHFQWADGIHGRTASSTYSCAEPAFIKKSMNNTESHKMRVPYILSQFKNHWSRF